MNDDRILTPQERLMRSILKNQGMSEEAIDAQIEKNRADFDKNRIRAEVTPEAKASPGQITDISVPTVDPEILAKQREERLSQARPGAIIRGEDAPPSSLTEDQKLKLHVLRQMSETGQLRGLKYDPRTK